MTDQEYSAEQVNAIYSARFREIDEVILDFANKIRDKLHLSIQKEHSAWTDPSWSPSQMSELLREHIETGDPVDVASFCLFLFSRNEKIKPAHDEMHGRARNWSTGISDSPVPVLYTDRINGSQVMRDDLWLVKTDMVQDSQRFRQLCSEVSGVAPEATLDGLGGFALMSLKPVLGANITQGVISQHFVDAVDNVISGTVSLPVPIHNNNELPGRHKTSASDHDSGYRSGYNRAIDDFTYYARSVSARAEQARTDVLVLREVVSECLSALDKGTRADRTHDLIDDLNFAPTRILAHIRSLKCGDCECLSNRTKVGIIRTELKSSMVMS